MVDNGTTTRGAWVLGLAVGSLLIGLLAVSLLQFRWVRDAHREWSTLVNRLAQRDPEAAAAMERRLAEAQLNQASASAERFRELVPRWASLRELPYACRGDQDGLHCVVTNMWQRAIAACLSGRLHDSRQHDAIAVTPPVCTGAVALGESREVWAPWVGAEDLRAACTPTRGTDHSEAPVCQFSVVDVPAPVGARKMATSIGVIGEEGRRPGQTRAVRPAWTTWSSPNCGSYVSFQPMVIACVNPPCPPPPGPVIPPPAMSPMAVRSRGGPAPVPPLEDAAGPTKSTRTVTSTGFEESGEIDSRATLLNRAPSGILTLPPGGHVIGALPGSAGTESGSFVLPLPPPIMPPLPMLPIVSLVPNLLGLRPLSALCAASPRVCLLVLATIATRASSHEATLARAGEGSSRSLKCR